jgi:hypothetical protein
LRVEGDEVAEGLDVQHESRLADAVRAEHAADEILALIATDQQA